MDGFGLELGGGSDIDIGAYINMCVLMVLMAELG